MLFALENPFEIISHHMNRTGSRIDAKYLLALACAIGGLWLAFVMIERWRKSRVERTLTAPALFSDLCALHDLGWSDRRLLQHATSHLAPVDQSRIFTDPTLLARLAQEQAEQAPKYARLAKVLFG